jgi:lycopene cyclase domain-containing protein
MMATFLLFALTLIAVALLLDYVVLRTRVIFTRHVLRTAGILMVTTLVFDNVLSALPVYIFNREKTLGIYLPWAPLEDLVYIVGVVFLVAVLDKHGRTRRAAAPHRWVMSAGRHRTVASRPPAPRAFGPLLRRREQGRLSTTDRGEAP